MILPDRWMQHKIPYKNRRVLSKEEIDAVSHYKDLKNSQHVWDYHPEPGEKESTTGMDCFMINSFMRGLLKQPVSVHDETLLGELIGHIDTAVSSYSLTENLLLFRGLGNPDWLEGFRIGQTFTEHAFGSFTTSKRTAIKYAMKRRRGRLVFQTVLLEKGDCALYIDTDESEWLLPKDITYKVTEISKLDNQIYGREGIVYYLSRINE